MASFLSTDPSFFPARNSPTLSLPLDIVPHILGSLDVSDLESCSLVTHAFHTISREIFFAQHLVLCGSTYEAKCSFLLGEKGASFFPRVKKLTLLLADIPGVTRSANPLHPYLSLFIRKVGPQLDQLSLDGVVKRNSWLTWMEPSASNYHDLLCTAVLPHIRSLKILNFNYLPLFTILSHCRQLQNFVITSPQYTSNPQQEEEAAAALKMKFPAILNLYITSFTKHSFELRTALAQYIDRPDATVTFLELSGYYPLLSSAKFPLHLDYLPPMESLRSTLQHVSLGLDMYDSIVRDYGDDDIPSLLPLPTFPQLRTLSLHMRLRSVESLEKWPVWFQWVSQNLSQATLPPNFDTLRLIVHDIDCDWILLHESKSSVTDQLAAIPGIGIDAILKTSGRSPQWAQAAAALLRSFLSAFEDAGNFLIWLSDLKS
ncbi:hypothetical protein DL96DRAFT_1580651 [Flagelloscypha sp. PMI_526]|nr:hypothetical protein DL96DRAFT_1580651 [Flagelloscypha sp. PMI_526]